jgi:TorA maturation chaperone TorD
MKSKADSTQNRSTSETALARNSIYGLLQFFFRNTPDIAFVNMLKMPQMIQKLQDIGLNNFEIELRNTPAGVIAEKLLNDYTNLFIIPGCRIPLNESAAKGDDGSFLGKPAMDIKRKVTALEIAIDESWTGFPDHISIHFELMKKLNEQESNCLDIKDFDNAEKCRNLQREFVKLHLLTWVPDICNKIIEKAGTSFYRELAALTKDFLEFERETIL